MAAQLGGSRDPAAFGTLLRRHRQAAALTQAELADRAGLGERTVSNLERGIGTRVVNRFYRIGRMRTSPSAHYPVWTAFSTG